ncbi:3-keto-5-aminohexanoate cleavage protein [Azorhizobium oxalatiphilum]|uniref:3-keto-5-aminohexanoate cleavage protein n=1 Tax=Azorhizobium oxalatiphilum TaxID=980631 RepID=A0A917C651_9HYPH|nr:3-keto-5-aminohexanoate cleavage protein [Azorhizobium oxalatiphilum]GGF72659.1 3-keto-5-aminohexanoate cleavage protein [Azorhizobium oxalatiphilum]
MRPILIMSAINGARRTRADHPALPMSALDIATESLRCGAAGATAIHLHVRDEAGRHSLDAGRYREVLAEIRARGGDTPILQVTTEAVGLYTPAEQMAMVRAVRPEAFSVAVRELFGDAGMVDAAATFLAECAEAGMAVQYILYDPEDVQRFDALLEAGTIPRGNAAQLFVLGRYDTGLPSEPASILRFLAARRHALDWSVCAFGPAEAACCMAAALLGGDVRMGFENNLHLPDGRVAPDNAALVAHFVAAAATLGLTPLTLPEARGRMGL